MKPATRKLVAEFVRDIRRNWDRRQPKSDPNNEFWRGACWAARVILENQRRCERL
jgi:hypothetical protein